MLSVYPACFYKEDTGYSVVFPDLNYLAICGKSLDEALNMAIDCLAGHIYWLKNDGEPTPEPSNINSIDPVAYAKELDPDEPAGECFVNLVSVDVATYAKEHFEKIS